MVSICLDLDLWRLPDDNPAWYTGVSLYSDSYISMLEIKDTAACCTFTESRSPCVNKNILTVP